MMFCVFDTVTFFFLGLRKDFSLLFVLMEKYCVIQLLTLTLDNIYCPKLINKISIIWSPLYTRSLDQ